MRPDHGMRYPLPGSGGPETGQGGPQLFSMDLLLDAVVIGVLLGCFYAAVSLGLSVSFGLLDVPHVAHPAFLVMASYGVFFLNDSFDIDPLLAGLLITPLLVRVRSCRLPAVLRDLRKARQRCRRARHRVLLRHRLHHRSADHPAIRRRPALGHAHPISARPGGSAICGSRSGWWSRSRLPRR